MIHWHVPRKKNRSFLFFRETNCSIHVDVEPFVRNSNAGLSNGYIALESIPLLLYLRLREDYGPIISVNRSESHVGLYDTPKKKGSFRIIDLPNNFTHIEILPTLIGKFVACQIQTSIDISHSGCKLFF